MLKTTFVTNIYFLSPFLTMLFAHVILGEVIEPYYLVIAVLVAIGILIQKFDKIGGTYSGNRHSGNKFFIFDVTGALAYSGHSAISENIRNGDKTLAIKLDTKYRDSLDKLAATGRYSGIFTDDNLNRKALTFLRDALKASNEEMVVVKVGREKEGNEFFKELSNLTKLDEGETEYVLPNEQK